MRGVLWMVEPGGLSKKPLWFNIVSFRPTKRGFYWIWDNWSGVLWESLFLQLFRVPSKRPKLWKGWGLPGRPEPQLVCVVPVAPGCWVNKVCFLSVHTSNPPRKITRHHSKGRTLRVLGRGANNTVAVPFGCTLLVLFMAGAQISRRTTRRPSFHQNTRGSNQHVRLTHKSALLKLLICPLHYVKITY